MSSFTRFDTGLKLQHVSGKYWVTLESFSFYLSENPEDKVIVPKGFKTDGASVPRVLWGLLPPWGDHGQAAVLHDFLIEVKELNTTEGIVYIDRHQARTIFKDALEVLDVPVIKRLLMLVGVWFWDHLKRN